MTNTAKPAKKESTHQSTPTNTPPGDPALTAFQRAILVILSEDARYGLAIKDALEDYYGSEVNHGRLYPNLDDLVNHGFVAKSELDKRTNRYAITDEGRDFLSKHLQWLNSKLDLGLDEEHTRTRTLVTDGGRCAECGAILPDEIVPDTGVYCTECGHGQLVTDGGTNASPELPSLLDVGATGAHWQQELADENIGSATYGGTFGLIHIHAGEDAKLFDQHRRHIYSAFDDALEELVGDLSDAALESRQGKASKQALFDQIKTVDAYDLRRNFLAWLAYELDVEEGEL